MGVLDEVCAAAYLEDHPESAPRTNELGRLPDFETPPVAVNEAKERKAQPVLALFDSPLASQQRLADRVRCLLPAVVAQALAGSSAQRCEHFLAQVEEYRRRRRVFVAPRILKFPCSLFREETASPITSHAAAPVAGLGVPMALARYSSNRRAEALRRC